MEGSQNNIIVDQPRFYKSKSATNPPYAWRIKLQAEYSLLSNSGGLAITLPNSTLTEYHPQWDTGTRRGVCHCCPRGILFYKTIPTGKD